MSDMSRFVQFWQNNPDRRDEINRARREKYQRDAEHREKVKDAAKSRYTPTVGKGRPKGAANRPRHAKIGDQLVLVLGLGAAAERLGLTKATLRNYDDKGIIPRNRTVDGLNRRWFPEAFIEFLKPIFADQRRRKDPLWRLKVRVETAWREAVGVPRFPEALEETRDGGEESRAGGDPCIDPDGPLDGGSRGQVLDDSSAGDGGSSDDRSG